MLLLKTVYTNPITNPYDTNFSMIAQLMKWRKVDSKVYEIQRMIETAYVDLLFRITNTAMPRELLQKTFRQFC